MSIGFNDSTMIGSKILVTQSLLIVKGIEAKVELTSTIQRLEVKYTP